jgi:hypothetical protein
LQLTILAKLADDRVHGFAIITATPNDAFA